MVELWKLLIILSSESTVKGTKMNLTHITLGTTLLALAAGSAYASGPIEVVDGTLVVNLGDARNNEVSRMVVLNPGDYADEISYSMTDESGVNTIGFVRGFTGDVSINSGKGKDTFKLLGLLVNDLTINTGAGNDTVYLNLVDASGAVDVRTGGGRDNITVINQVAEGSFSIRSQDGIDDVSIANSSFDGAVAVRTGGGNDDLSVSFSNFEARPLFNGQGGNNDTYIDGGGNGFWDRDPRIVRFENIEDITVEDPIDNTPDPVILAIGDTGPGGGIVFQVNNAGTAGLEVSPGVVAAQSTYGCAGVLIVPETEIPQQDPLRLGLSGENNSARLAAANVQGVCDSPAAEAAFSFTTNNGATDDWILPSANELALLLTTLSTTQFPRAVPGGYWSSSENTPDNAFIVFETAPGVADISPNSKNSSVAVLAIRAFGS